MTFMPIQNVPGEVGAMRGPSEAPATVEAAYAAYRDRLFGVALRSTRNRDVAEDLIQDAYLRLLVAARAGSLPDNVPAWLHRVTMNLVVDWSRRSKVRASTPQPLPEMDGDDPEACLLNAERAAALHRALTGLPRQTRHALLLDGAGYRPQEIGVAIGRSDGATRTLLCRARQRTRALLAGAEM